jgi:2-octaprenyl-3-methyl-6-methoxy-1,4-benzoquinol hydroxylase
LSSNRLVYITYAEPGQGGASTAAARGRLSEDALAAYSFEAINALFSNQSLLPTLARGHLLGLAGRIPPLAHLLWRRAAGL